MKNSPRSQTQPLLNPQLAATRVAELAWAGQHAPALELATQAIARVASQDVATRLNLFTLRAESYIALGHFERAATEASALLALAHANPAFMAHALNLHAKVQAVMGEVQLAVTTATAAVNTARALTTPHPALLAHCLQTLSEAHKDVGAYAAALETAQAAIHLFEALGDVAGTGRAHWVMAPVYNILGNAEKSRHAAQTALDLCQQAGDQFGMGNAFNALSSTDLDIAERIQHYQQAIQAFEAAGHRERQATAIGNLGFAYAALGLYLHARRLTAQALEMTRAMGAKLSIPYWLENLADVEIRLGALASAQTHLHDMAQLLPAFSDPRITANMETNYGIMALAEGQPAIAVRHFQAAAQRVRAAGLGNENVHLTYLGWAHLQNGDPLAALAATTQATAMHREQGFKLPDSFTAQEIWWRHTQALLANQHPEAAQKALEQAYGFLLEAITNLHDEGLRRNYLNKVPSNRELLQFWVSAGHQRALLPQHLFAHLALESNAREPFKRLTLTSARLNALHTVAALQTFLVEEALELSGGERVLFIAENHGRPEVVASLLPLGEDARQMLATIDAYIAYARLTRNVSLTLPEPPERLSRIIAPLIAQNEIIGYLYTDMEVLYGAFTEVDRDMLGMLANQASVALDNAQWAEGLERKVAERTAELNARVDELAIITRVQMGLASKLDISAIYELIGEQLRSMFDSQAISIASFDVANNVRHYQYVLEKGQRLEIRDAPIAPLSNYIIRHQAPLLINENYAESIAALGVAFQILPGTEAPLSILRVPILVNGEVQSVIGLDHIDRENAFSDSDVRLLTTLANGMSVALENARLFQEAQAARVAADAASVSKSAFLANMSHELRTPLNAILGFTRIVRRKAEGALPEKQIENLDKVLTSAEHLLGLINAVLDIAKIEAGRMEVTPSNFSISGLVELCVGQARPRLKPEVSLSAQVPEDLGLISSDQEKVKQIIANLLSNATKFTPAGAITVTARVEPSDKLARGHGDKEIPAHPVSLSPPQLVIAVTDTGIGISADVLRLLFGQFQQADASSTRKYGGTGLGLAISRSLARLLGGDLTVSSEPGVGSTFTLTLPASYKPLGS